MKKINTAQGVRNRSEGLFSKGEQGVRVASLRCHNCKGLILEPGLKLSRRNQMYKCI